jgi:hypothetical protein
MKGVPTNADISQKWREAISSFYLPCTEESRRTSWADNPTTLPSRHMSARWNLVDWQFVAS